MIRRLWYAFAAAGAAVALGACSGASPGTPASGGGGAGASAPSQSRSSSPSSSVAPRLVASRLQVPDGLGGAPFDEPREVQAPPGWRVSVWARVSGSRLAVWAPDGALLVSRPGAGEVVALRGARGSASGTSQQVLAQGLTQPHGLAFDGRTLYVAESDRIDAYTYTSGGLTGRRTVVDALPDAKSPELGGRYAHALKSAAVGKDGWLYFSIGSTGNVSPEDRDADPQRAAILRVRPSGGAPQVYARGVRNGTGLAVDPTGAVWTAVNNRDNIAYPYNRDYDGDGSPDRDRVLQSYVNDHPLEPLARLTPGRDLGWPYCNPDPDVHPGVPGSALTYTRRPYVRDVQRTPTAASSTARPCRPSSRGCRRTRHRSA